MANRYWVGTTQDWHLASNWSSTSGGAGGAGVPTSIDDVYFDGNGYILCWPVSDIQCNNMTFETTTTEMLLIDANATINGDFEMNEGYFGPTGGPDHIIEFKGNWLKTSGTFAVGTGPGYDPTCVFSGTSKTYQLNDVSGATYQNLTVSGSYTFSGTRLSVADIYENLDISGTMTIAQGNWVQLTGHFNSITGTLNGDGTFSYFYDSTNSIPTTGTIKTWYFRIIVDDSNPVTITAREWTYPCIVQIEYVADGQVVRFDNNQRHYFRYNLEIIGDDMPAGDAELDFATNKAELFCKGTFKVNQNAFPANNNFTIRFGDGIHIFRQDVQFYFSYSSDTSHLIVDGGNGTIIFWLASIEVYNPGGFGLIKMSATHRLSRIYSGGIDLGVYNKVIVYQEPKYSGLLILQGSNYFLEGFNAFEFLVEMMGMTVNFRKSGLNPYMKYEFERLKINGNATNLPTLREKLSQTPSQFHFQVNDDNEINVFSCKLRYAEGINEINTYNSTDLTDNVNIQFYDKDSQLISNHRNILNSKDVLNSCILIDLEAEIIVEKALI